MVACWSKNARKCFTATKGGGWGAAQGKLASHFAIRYAVVQCCHYQRKVAGVLEYVLFL